MMRLSRSVVGEREAEAVRRVLVEDGYLGMGSEVQRFEAQLAKYFKVPETHLAVVNSGTAAVHLAVSGALRPGDEILVQSLTFVATFQGISAAGVVPVACEIRPETVTIDLEDAARRVTPRTRAIMPVHYASNPAGLDDVYDFAAKHGLRVIEDAAHAFGCDWKGGLVGAASDVACFSFDGIKNITSAEGGMVISADMQVMQYVRDARLLGVERDTEKRYAGERSWDFDVSRQGYRFHMSNVLAAVGRVQLDRFHTEFAPARIALARRYRDRLGPCRGLTLLDPPAQTVVPHIMPVRILGGRRDALRAGLAARDIETGIHYKPNHLLTYYRRPGVDFPVTQRVYAELLSLPLHPMLTIADIDSVCDAVVELADGSRQ